MALPAARYRTRQANDPPIRRPDRRVVSAPGTDLTQLHGFGAYTALRRIGECGTDMTKMAHGQTLHLVADLSA